MPPVPFLAKELGNTFSPLIPMPVDSGLDEWDVGLGDGSFPDGKGQHFNCIAERMRGRQEKMHGDEKNCGLRKILPEIGSDCGLK